MILGINYWSFEQGLTNQRPVREAARQAKAAGFEAIVVDDLTRAVGLPGTVDAMTASLNEGGVGTVRLGSFAER